VDVLEARGARGPGHSARASAPSVAHVVPEYLPRSATFIHTLLRHQTRFRPLVLAQVTSHLDEFPVERVQALGEPARLPVRTVRALRARAAGFRSDYERRIADEAGREACVLVHGHFGWSGRDSVRAASRLDVPLVTTFYGRDLSEADRARLRDPYRRLFAEGSRFIVEGPAMVEHLVRAGSPRERVRIVPIGIELDAFPFSERPRTSPLVVVQCARFAEKKGVDLTIRAFAEARSLIGPSELLLIGDGELRDELEALAARLGCSDAVRFAGMVSLARYRDLVARAHVCVQPSRTATDGDSEGGAPTVILEMQAMGVPVVATRHADIPFVVPRPEELAREDDIDALAGTLCRVASESDEERRARVREARAFVERRHDAAVTAAAVEDVYDEVLT
jgi:colanic acid/amylovoran biosynthesis glycosyltransferase